MAINDKYLAMAWIGKDKKVGNIKLVDSNKPKDLKNDNYFFISEQSNILDMEFSPFDSSILSFYVNFIKIFANFVVFY